jgi:molecular chaperone GrpE
VTTDNDNDDDNGVDSTPPAAGEAPVGQSAAGDRAGTDAEANAEAIEPDPLATAQAEAARLKGQLLRTAADFDNFRKRARRELQEGERRGAEEMLKSLLPVFDNLERAAAHAGAATEVRALADGIALVVRQFGDTLSKLGIERVPTVGSVFDPALHEAVQHVETIEHPPGSVAVEVQSGYRLGERLIRPAMVCVAKAPAEKAGAPVDGGANPGEPAG